MADHILVLEDGRIIEQGSHDELIARGGRYAALFEMQAGRYR
jgi:ATP-binding cassette subfamily B protein